MTTGNTTIKIKNALAQAQERYVQAKAELAAAYSSFERTHSTADKRRILTASVRVTAATLDIRRVQMSGYQNVCDKQVRS